MNLVIKKSSMKWSNRDQTSQNCSSCSRLFCRLLGFYTFATLYRGLLLELSWDPTPPTHFLKLIQIPVLELSGTLWLHYANTCIQPLVYSLKPFFPQTLTFFFPSLRSTAFEVQCFYLKPITHSFYFLRNLSIILDNYWLCKCVSYHFVASWITGVLLSHVL